jgi:hypothetical protein
VAQHYGARVIAAQLGEKRFDKAQPEKPSPHLQSALHPWILCLDPHESISESLVASLFEWKSQPLSSLPNPASGFSIRIREETAQGWTTHPAPHTRLVPRTWTRWQGIFPAHEPSAPTLEGEILRFVFP